MREELKKFYLECVNDFLTVIRFAEYHEIPINDARVLVNIGKAYHKEDSNAL